MKQVEALQSINADVWKFKKLKKRNTSKQEEGLAKRKRS